MKYYVIYFIFAALGTGLLCLQRPLFGNRLIHSVVFVIISAGMALFLWNVTIPNAYYVDFTKAYYEAGRLILSNPAEMYKGRQPEFVNLPIVAFLFSPFVLMEKFDAVHVMVMISVIAVIISCFSLMKAGQFEGSERFLVIWLFVVNGPLYYSIRLGNMTHFVLLLIPGIIYYQDRKPLLAGALTAICAIIKLPLLLLGIYYMLRKRWAMVAGFWSTLLIVTACSLLVLGLDLHIQWYVEVIQRHFGKAMGAYNNQSINGLLAHLIPNNNLYSWVEFSTGWKFKLIQLVILGLIVGPTVWVLWRAGPPSTRSKFNLEFSTVLCVSILVSPISWIHYYSLLIVPAALVLGGMTGGLRIIPVSKKIWEIGFFIVAISLIALPVVHTLKDAVVPEIPIFHPFLKHILVSHYFIGGLSLLGFLLYTRNKTSLEKTLADGVYRPQQESSE